jgi:hypothetical protein
MHPDICLFYNPWQPFTGLWEVTEVTAGERLVTPVSKWTRIHPDGTFESGNGWLQNSVGTWVFEEKTSEFFLSDKFGLKDEYGPFLVQFTNREMIWTREEDGMKVVVRLRKIESLPVSTADLLIGLWDLEKAEQAGNGITNRFDPDNKYYVFIRWDRIYVERTPAGDRQAGYWHINAHRPEVTFLSHVQGKNPESWKVEVSEKSLEMRGISESNQDLVLFFRRIHQFPE